MSYIPTVWKAEDIITSELLNKMENGILNAEAVVVHVSMENNALIADIGLEEISMAIAFGKPVFAMLDDTLFNLQVSDGFVLGGAVMGLNALGEESAVFVHTNVNSNVLTYRAFSVAADKTVTMSSARYALTPSV